MNEISQPPAEESIRWTYDGTMDDMVAHYPWPGIPIGNSKQSLDLQLVYSAVAGTPMLLNDGYLVFNPACYESLRDPYSPLRILINEKYVRVLSRNPKQSLEEMVRDGAREGIGNRKELLNDTERWTATQQVLNTAEADLRKQSAFVGWPLVNISSSYHLMIRSLMKRSSEELWRDQIPYQAFRKVADRFDDEMSRSARKARSKWEEIVKDEAETEADINALMWLANEVYHHNFGVALSARPPADLPKNAEVAVQSRVSEAFSDLYKLHTSEVPSAAMVVPEIVLPSDVDYSKGNLLLGLFDLNSPVGKCRKKYLTLRARYRTEGVSTEEMEAAKDEYQGKLHEYLFASSPRGKFATHAANAGISTAAGLLAFSIAGPVPAIVIGVCAYFGSDFAVPRVMEKWRFPGDVEHAAVLKLQDLRDKVTKRRVLTSLAVNRTEAQRLVDPLPVL
jgi:hypothetical protein